MLVGSDFVLHSNEEYINKLLKELELHDSEVEGLKLENNCLQIDISCKGMNLDNYFNDIDNVIVTIKVYNIYKLEFDYLGGFISVNEFKMIEDNNIHIIINENDLDVIGSRYEISFKENKKYDEKNRNIDNLLKNY